MYIRLERQARSTLASHVRLVRDQLADDLPSIEPRDTSEPALLDASLPEKSATAHPLRPLL